MSIARLVALIFLVLFISLLLAVYLMMPPRQQVNETFELRLPNSSIAEASIKSFETVSTNADSMSPDFSMVDFFRYSDEIMGEVVKKESVKLILIQDGSKLGEFVFSKVKNDSKEYSRLSAIIQLIHEKNKHKKVSQPFMEILDAVQRRNPVLVYSKEGSSARSSEYLVISTQDKNFPTPFVAYVSSRN